MQRNEAYLAVILLSRVILKLGELREVTPATVEGLFSADFAYLQDLYRRINANGHSDVTVLCPECEAGHLDLSLEAFAEIAPVHLGIVPITWQVISPNLSGPIAYHFKDGSNQWWTAVQIHNHRNPIATLEYWNGSAWVNVPRTSYNYFVQTNPGMGPGPYSFRVTDHYGNVLTDSGIPHIELGTVQGSGQFPPGP